MKLSAPPTLPLTVVVAPPLSVALFGPEPSFALSPWYQLITLPGAAKQLEAPAVRVMAVEV